MRNLLVYGSSLFLGGIFAHLQTVANIQTTLHQTLDGIGNLSAFDAVLIDLNDSTSADVLCLVRARPDFTVIGLNSHTNAVTMLSGKVYLAQSVGDVISILSNAGEPLNYSA
jgi:hypothetical protein